jgi:hypothetical protein
MQLSEETRFFGYDLLQLAGVKPHAAAVEALIDANVAEGDLLQLHPALRAFHEMQRLLPFTLLCLDLRLPLSRELPPPLDLLPPEILFFVLAGLLNHVVLWGG